MSGHHERRSAWRPRRNHATRTSAANQRALGAGVVAASGALAGLTAALLRRRHAR